jgi:hypothetical protein
MNQHELKFIMNNVAKGFFSPVLHSWLFVPKTAYSFVLPPSTA